MEGIREQLVKKRPESSDKVKSTLVLLATLVVAIAVFFVILYYLGIAMIIVAIVLSACILWGGYKLTGEFNTEYEYCFSAGELSVDKVINQRRRKHICSLVLRSADSFYRNPSKLPDNATVISALGEDDDVYGIEYTDAKYGRAILLFTPSDTMLETIKPYLPRAI